MFGYAVATVVLLLIIVLLASLNTLIPELVRVWVEYLP